MTTPYLSEERFRQMGLGVDLDGVESVEIRSKLLAASAAVDSACNVPRIPQPYSFRGGTVTDQLLPWYPGDYLTPMQRRIFLSHTPVKEVTAFAIYVTNNQYTAFSVNDLFVSPQGIAEITSLSLTPYSIFGGAVIPNLGLGRPQARITYTYGYSYSSTDEYLEETDGRTYSAQNQFWDDGDVEVTVDGTVVTTGFTIDREEGAIVFDVAQSGTAVVRASYSYTLPHEIAEATALLAANSFVEKDLLAKGLGNVRSLKVGEISIDRGRLTNERTAFDLLIPPHVELLLANWRFVTVR